MNNDWENDPSIWGDSQSTPAPAPAKPRGFMQRLSDIYEASSINNPIGGGGLARGILSLTHPRDVVNAAARAASDEANARLAADGPDTLAQHDTGPMDRAAWLGRKAAEFGAGMLGGVDPTFAVSAGKNAVRRIATQGVVQGAASPVRQKIDQNTGMSDATDIDWGQAAKEAGWGAAFAGLGEAAGAGVRALASRKGGKLIAAGASHPAYDDMVPITIHSESRGNPNAVSPKGASGTMQVMPDTITDPGFGIKASNGTQADTARVGRQYLAAMMGKYDGDAAKAWAAYNWGPGHLDRTIGKYGDDWFAHTPPETKAYVSQNMDMLSAKGHANVAIEINKPQDLNPDGSLRGARSVAPMDPTDIADIMHDPAAAGLFQDAPEGLQDLAAGRLRLADDVHPDPFGGKPPEDLERFTETQPDPFGGRPPQDRFPQMEQQAAARLPDPVESHLQPAVQRRAPDPVLPNEPLQGEQTFAQHEQEPQGRIYEGGGDEEPIPAAEYSDDHPVRQLYEALKAAKPVRGMQDRLTSAERSRRVAAMGAIFDKGGPGRETAAKAMAQLKGEYPKADFESIADKISPEAGGQLFAMINSNNRLSTLSKAPAISGLTKMLGGEAGGVPTKSEMAALERVLPKDLLDELEKKRPGMDKFWDVAMKSANIPRTLMSSVDLSAPLRQGVFMVGRKEFYKSFFTMFHAFGSEDAFKAVQDGIRARPTYDAMEEAGLAIADVGDDLTKREEAFASPYAEKIPVLGKLVRASDRAYTAFLNKLRADVFDTMYKQGKEMGIDFNEDPRALKDTAKFINAATGRGKFSDILGFSLGEHDPMAKLDQAAPLLNTGLFSPRLIASRLTMLNPNFYLQLHPLARKEALKSLFAFSSVALTVLGLAKQSGLDVEADPRSSDFGNIKVGNTRYDILGGFKQYITYGARMISGQTKTQSGDIKDLDGSGYKGDTRMDVTGRFLRGKEAPIPSFIHDMMAGWKNVVGEDQTLASEAQSHLTPMNYQTVKEAYDEWMKNSDDPIKGAGQVAAATAASTLGVGVNTYKPREKKERKERESSGMSLDPNAGFGMNANWENDPSIWGKK